MTSFKWVNNQRPDKVWATDFDAYAGEVKSAVEALLISFAPRVESYMKLNAPWTDRTGNARQSLAAEFENTPTAYGLTFGYANDIEYADKLEFANQGRYQIVGPTLDTFSVQIFDELKALFS